MNQSTKKAHSNISDFLTEESNYTDYWGMLDFLTTKAHWTKMKKYS